MFRYYSRLTK